MWFSVLAAVVLWGCGANHEGKLKSTLKAAGECASHLYQMGHNERRAYSSRCRWEKAVEKNWASAPGHCEESLDFYKKYMKEIDGALETCDESVIQLRYYLKYDAVRLYPYWEHDCIRGYPDHFTYC